MAMTPPRDDDFARRENDPMRFSIRDLLWATLVVSIGLGWWSSYRAVDAKRLEAVGQAQRHRVALQVAHEVGDELSESLWEHTRNKFLVARWAIEIDRHILDEPLVEP
jgi:hypothetical protein